MQVYTIQAIQNFYVSPKPSHGIQRSNSVPRLHFYVQMSRQPPAMIGQQGTGNFCVSQKRAGA